MPKSRPDPSREAYEEIVNDMCFLESVIDEGVIKTRLFGLFEKFEKRPQCLSDARSLGNELYTSVFCPFFEGEIEGYTDRTSIRGEEPVRIGKLLPLHGHTVAQGLTTAFTDGAQYFLENSDHFIYETEMPELRRLSDVFQQQDPVKDWDAYKKSVSDYCEYLMITYLRNRITSQEVDFLRFLEGYRGRLLSIGKE